MPKFRKTIRISDETNDLIKTLSAQFNMSEGRLIEMAVKNIECSQIKTPEAVVDAVEKSMHRLEEQNYHLLNMINSLVENLDYRDYYDNESQASSWLQKSRTRLADSKLRAQLNSLIKDKKEFP